MNIGSLHSKVSPCATLNMFLPIEPAPLTAPSTHAPSATTVPCFWTLSEHKLVLNTSCLMVKATSGSHPCGTPQGFVQRILCTAQDFVQRGAVIGQAGDQGSKEELELGCKQHWLSMGGYVTLTIFFPETEWEIFSLPWNTIQISHKDWLKYFILIV